MRSDLRLLPRLASLLVLATLIALVPGRVAALDDCGDADGDDVLTVSDGVQTLRAAAGLASPCTLERCDVDGSGAVTLTDGVGILSRAAGLPVFQFHRCRIPSQVRDFSRFAHFELDRRSGLGFCPPFGSVFSVALDRQENGKYRAHFTVAEERPFDHAGCIEAFVFGNETCVAAVSRPDRVLTAAEGARLAEAFTAVATYEVRQPECAILAFDPCLIDRLAWDDASFDDSPCSVPRIPYEAVDAVTAVLDRLLVGGEASAR